MYKETNGYSLIIDDPDDLQGLPNEEIDKLLC